MKANSGSRHMNAALKIFPSNFSMTFFQVSNEKILWGFRIIETLEGRDGDSKLSYDKGVPLLHKIAYP